jgi:MFS family permease
VKYTNGISRHNFYSFLWHAAFLALAQNFMDVDTVIPAMLVEAGGNGLHIGFMTAIMLGGSSFTQLIFAPFLSNYPYKKKFLLLGINARILSLFFLSFMLYSSLEGNFIIWMIFILITFFSLGGAFANVSYTDILGKSIDQSTRKSFFSIKQVAGGLMLLISALFARKVLSLESFPLNYSYMFFIGFLALFVASFGFWRIKEIEPSGMMIKNPGHFISRIRTELLQNKKLIYFLGFINSMGIGIALMPFIMLYAKDLFNTQSHDTGSFLLFKVIGTVSTGFLLFLFNQKFKYRYVLYVNTILVIMVLGVLLVSSGRPPFMILFLAGGVILSLYMITMNGILLEISNTGNRALYAGIAGAGNIIPALFPILGGWVIEHSGYSFFFGLFMVIILFSLFFIYKLDCKK